MSEQCTIMYEALIGGCYSIAIGYTLFIMILNSVMEFSLRFEKVVSEHNFNVTCTVAFTAARLNSNSWHIH